MYVVVNSNNKNKDAYTFYQSDIDTSEIEKIESIYKAPTRILNKNPTQERL